MQKLDRATLTELYWRDYIFWILGARPLGVIYSPIIWFLINLIFAVPLHIVYCFDRKKVVSKYLETEFLKREIFTLANLVSLYGLFLCGEVLNWYLRWLFNFELPKIYSISAWLTSNEANPAWLMAWQILEIFLTDIIDGPLARLNLSVTALGTFLDHFRDYKIGSISFLILITLTIEDAYMEVLVLELAALAGFMGIFIYHSKFFRLKFKNHEFQNSGFWGKIKERIEFLCDFALNEYQTDLIGRIQFGATAFAICSGLFYFATQNDFIHIAFIISMTASIAVTYFYLYKLWGRHMEKLRESMQEKSDRMKEKLVDKTIELKGKATQRISAGEKAAKPKKEKF